LDDRNIVNLVQFERPEQPTVSKAPRFEGMNPALRSDFTREARGKRAQVRSHIHSRHPRPKERRCQVDLGAFEMPVVPQERFDLGARLTF
jgi:hypothetical protein